MPRIDVIWKLHPKQDLAYYSHATEILYGGAAGGGKSHLTRIALLSWCLDIPGLQVYLFRREFADLLRNHVEGPTGFVELLSQHIRYGAAAVVGKEIRFANGSKIYLCHCQHERDVFGYQGAEIHVLAVEEASQFTEFQLRYLRTRVRMPKEYEQRIPDHLRGMFPRALLTANPGGPGHSYLKAGFIDPHPSGVIFRAPAREGGMLRQFIQARLEDNPSLDADQYALQLQGLGSPAYVRALLDGDWSVTVGAYFPELDPERHVLPDFAVPAHWFRYRSFDWGGASPFVVHWWCVADGEYVPALGRPLPRGALICYREWYGCQPDAPSKGLGMRNEDIARGIISRSPALSEKRMHTVTDSLPFQDRGGVTIAETFADHGILLTHGDTSRIPGWSQLRSRLIGDERGPQLYFVETCRHTLRTLPLMQHDPVDPEELIGLDDHCADSVRLACTARARVTDAPAREPDTAHAKGIAQATFDQVIEKHFQQRRSERDGGW